MEKYNQVGKILKSHGVKGEVKVESHSRFINERFKPGNTLYIKEKESYRSLKIISRRGSDDALIILFEGFDNPESLYPILHKTLYGEKDKSLLKEGEHFRSAYIGATVIQFGIEKGKVIGIEKLPQCDYLIIKNNEGKDKLVPFLDHFLGDLDEEKNILYLKEVEGLLWLDLMS